MTVGSGWLGEEIGLVVDPYVGAGATWLRLVGELDLATAPTFMDALATALQPRPALVVLDLSQLTYIDARSAGSIATASKRMSGWGGTLAACEPQGLVRRIFDICGFGHLLVAPSGPTRAARSPAGQGIESPRARAEAEPGAVGSPA